MFNAERICHQEELEEPTFNFYINTVEEFKAPFLEKKSAVYQGGLRLVSLETTTLPCPYGERLNECNKSGTYFSYTNTIIIVFQS